MVATIVLLRNKRTATAMRKSVKEIDLLYYYYDCYYHHHHYYYYCSEFFPSDVTQINLIYTLYQSNYNFFNNYF